jgi:transcriptional regulator with GAF, ATPase, and Fis domain
MMNPIKNNITTPVPDSGNEKQLDKSVADLQMLNRLAQAIGSTMEVEKILAIILQETLTLAAAEKGSILSLATEGERQMHTLFKTGDSTADLQLSRLSDLVGGWVIRNGTSLMTDEITDDPRFRKASDWLNDVASVLAVPMVVRSDITGIIILTKTAKFTQSDLELMTIVANQCAQFLENAKRYQRIYQENQQLRREVKRRYDHHGIIGSSPAMNKVFQLLERILPGETRILIEGESGTGKELIARTIHYNGPRKDNKFIPVDCGALSESLLESELFGYVKGAFTGATAYKKGLFEIADQGTLFLDEITNTSLNFQTKLLRAIQEGEIKPVGATEPRKVDVRLIVAASGNLKAKVAAEEFREDLYYRLNVITVNLPPLREREGDIRLLAEHFLHQFAKKVQPARQVKGFSAATMRYLENYSWPGNIRELENVIERAVALTDLVDKMISPELLPSSLTDTEFSQIETASDQSGGKLTDTIDRTECRIIKEALEKNAGNRTKTAKSLGIARPTLLLKMKKHKIDFKVK